MRGSNVTIYRFFEDPDREYLPWDKEWGQGPAHKIQEYELEFAAILHRFSTRLLV